MVATLAERTALMAAVAHELRRQRINRGSNLKEASNRIGISHSVLCRMELARSPLSVNRLIEICSVLGIEPSEVFILAQAEALPFGWSVGNQILLKPSLVFGNQRKGVSKVEHIKPYGTLPPEGASIEDSVVTNIIAMVADRLHYLRVVQRTPLAQLSEDSGIPKSRLTRIELQKIDCGLRDGILLAATLGVRFSDIMRYVEDETFPAGEAPWLNGRQSPSVRFVLEMEPFEYDTDSPHNYVP